MKVTEVKFVYRATMNMGNYESVGCEVGMTATLGEDEDPLVALATLQLDLQAIAHKEMVQAYKSLPTVTAREQARKEPF